MNAKRKVRSASDLAEGLNDHQVDFWIEYGSSHGSLYSAYGFGDTFNEACKVLERCGFFAQGVVRLDSGKYGLKFF